MSERARLSLLADALAALGTQRAMVVHGEPGLDEVSPLGVTSVVEVRGRITTHWEIDPDIAGVPGVRADDLQGGDPAENATLIETVLKGGGPPGAVAAVLLNAAAAYYVSGKADTYEMAVDVTRAALASGVGALALDRLRRASHRAAGVGQ